MKSYFSRAYIVLEIFSKSFQRYMKNAKQSLQEIVSMKQRCIFLTPQQIDPDVRMSILHERGSISHLLAREARPLCVNRATRSMGAVL